jgi:hypothetical protein
VATAKEKYLDQRQRLQEMREHLRIRVSIADPSFGPEVVATCVRQVQPIIDAQADRTGEEINAALAQHFGVHFEEVRTQGDIQRLELKYLVERREIGFGQLADELADGAVDALLFERIHAAPGARDRWVAVLNIQETQARAYWSRPHELVHRLAEPPQKRLKFFRHRTDAENRLERIIDLGAAELAFPKSVYGRLVAGTAHRELTWETLRSVHRQFAPTSSLLAAAKAFVRYWPRPAFLLTAALKRSKQRPNEPPSLRVSIGGLSDSGKRTGIQFIPNMRVPKTSPLASAFASSTEQAGFENLGTWTTSNGRRLPDRRALTASIRLGPVAYALVSLV